MRTSFSHPVALPRRSRNGGLLAGRMTASLVSSALATALMATSAQAQNAGEVSGFRLPPSPGSVPTQPEQQGPAEEESARPQAQPSASETQPTVQPTPPAERQSQPPVVTVPVPAPPVVLPARQPQPQTRPVAVPSRAAAQAAVPSVTATAPDAAPAVDAITETAAAQIAPSGTDSSLFGTGSATSVAPAPHRSADDTSAADASDDGSNTVWWLALAGFAAVLGGGFVWWRRSRSPYGSTAAVPVLVRPVVPPRPAAPAPAPTPQSAVPASQGAPSLAASGVQPRTPPPIMAPLPPQTPAPAPAPAAVPVPKPAKPAIPAPTAAEIAATTALLSMPEVVDTAQSAVTFAMEARKFSLTLMNATLAYTVTLTNTSDAPVMGLILYGDLTGGNAATAQDVQFSGPSTEASALHTIDQLAPGETRELRGEMRLPLAAITPIRQGAGVATLPLASFRLAGGADEAAPRIYAVGEASKAGQTDSHAALTPFRLDQGPRIFNQIVLRRFA